MPINSLANAFIAFTTLLVAVYCLTINLKFIIIKLLIKCMLSFAK